MEFDDLTQATQNTQGVLDPRRLGRNNSGMTDAHISDVICVLHPCSPAAFKIVAETARYSPHNILQNEIEDFGDGITQSAVEEKETFILDENAPNQAMDLALRFSANVKSQHLGFVFGRHPGSCDIVLAQDTYKRISNMHFRIFINFSGVLMLQDISTNGTMVDDIVLRSKVSREAQTRMLNPGSIIQILSPKTDEVVKFIVRIPSREGHAEDYQARVQAYLQKVQIAEMKFNKKEIPLTRGAAAQQNKTQNSTSIKAPLIQNHFGMHWSGGDRYNVVGRIGKGAFATVFQLATKAEGRLYAAKELEKRKFIKNGVLDRKLDNEMQIMKSVSHPNIVQYVEYQDHTNHMYIVMEFVPGGDLQDYLANKGPLLEDPLAKKMASQVLDALAYLHKKKITHRDIKPDNILLADLEPDTFTVKLSDFGLSKVVQDNDTFLKTFCGTLLYCAPEVFPHYDAHVGGKGKKRPRQGKPQQASKFHSYSQSVDIWSFGAVLWFSLCMRPPFEGVADANGKGMFDKIMMTPLDARDLVEQGVSKDAVALLVEMLNTDPATRPSPVECLQHRWFGFADASRSQNATGGAEDDLVSIAEEDEADGVEEPDVSGLSLDEQDSSRESQTSEVSIHSGSLEFLDPRQSKRFKSDIHAYRDPDEMIDSSPEIFYQSIPIIHQPEAASAGTGAQPKPPKLFGEISQSALQSSALLGQRAGVAVQTSGPSQDASNDGEQDDSSRGAFASPSLLGAESMVREMNMDSPQSTNSYDANVHEPITPKTPGNAQRASNAFVSHGGEATDDITPRQPQPAIFSRQINIPIPASFYYEADDPSTHNLEYATQKSGHNYLSNGNHLDVGGVTSLPSTENGSATENEDEIDLDEVTKEVPQPPVAAQTEFVKPLPRLGKLTSTSDSFTKISLNLSSRLSYWGRSPDNTHIYEDKHDTRIPKRAFAIWFHARDIGDIPESDQSWMKLPDLHCVLSTESTQGILINGVKIRKGEMGRTTYGRVYTGDVITVVQGSGSQEDKRGLSFICEFFHGEAKQMRPADGARFVVDTEGKTQHLQRSKSKGKENEITAMRTRAKDAVM